MERKQVITVESIMERLDVRMHNCMMHMEDSNDVTKAHYTSVMMAFEAIIRDIDNLTVSADVIDVLSDDRVA